jgi:hypothetical protein
MTVFQILEKVHLNPFTKIYEKIFLILNKPDDNADDLLKYLKIVSRKKLTPFKDYYNTEYHCYYAFVYPKNSSNFITTKNVDKLINIIIESGYKIEYNMMNLLKEKDRKDIFCFISK